MVEIKPVAQLCESGIGSRWWNTDKPVCNLPLGAYYDQSAIDAMRAEVERLRELCRDMLPVFEASRPLVLNLERLKDAAKGGGQ